ncbi:ParA family protein [Pectobacterium polaris]|uniref:ParA family protein n=1 Tax=Pectobacterium polaris TaxID=2042057 RepID=UPI001C2E7E85|nr:ParA family protein [Pectobacterium polaris]
MTNKDELVGINEIALMANVSKQAVANWRVRASDFPRPVVELASGPIFRKSHIRAWLRRNKRKGKSMTHIISTINLKGGVAKTTTTIALAETFSANMGKKVLVIDLDPQTNATLMLIGEDKWFELNKKERTLARLFKDAMDPDNRKFDLSKTLQKKVSDVGAARTVDLLPSSLDLIDVQDTLASAPAGKFYAANPIEFLWRAVKSKIDEYDIVLVDCPPNLGIITLNGLRISDGYIIPTIPDHLSTYGIPQIITRISDFSEAITEEIEPIGIVATKYQANSNVHNNVLKQLRDDQDLPVVMSSIIRQANQVAAAAEFQSYSRTLKQKYGSELANQYDDLAREIWEHLEGEL